MRGRVDGKVGIALAGGGPLGGIYEIGALLALETALKGRSLTELDLYVGVSSGAFVAAGLANGISPAEMHAMFILDRSHHDPFEPDLLLRPAFGEFRRRLTMLPRLMRSALLDTIGPGASLGFVESFARLTRGLPNGLFDNGAIAGYLGRLFGKPGRTDDFRQLGRKLFVVATDLDTGRATPFGAPGFDHVPISEAVKASAALPGLYPPARIDGHDYVDGALKKTLHASVALKAGAKLLICINPLVPFDAELAARSGRKPRPLAEQGLAAVLSQTFRSLIYSRMQVGMERYRTEFPDADVVLFEPARDDEVMFSANVFSYADRKRLAEHACRHTLNTLAARAAELGPVFARHGILLDLPALSAPAPGLAAGKSRRLWDSVRPLGETLSALETTLSGHRPDRSQGGSRDAAKAAAPHA